MLMLKNEEGYTLIVVLWSIVILTVIFSYILDDYYLDSYLIENYSEQKQLRDTALSAYNIAVNSLMNDQTLYDTDQDNWLKAVEGSNGIVHYQIKISDAGGFLNINYTDLDVLREIEGWETQVEDLIEGELVADPFMLEDYFPEVSISTKLTSLGKFNINHDSPDKLEKMFDFQGLTYVFSEVLVEDIKNYRKEGRSFSDLASIPALIDGVDISTFEKIKPFLTLEGRININYVDEETLAAIIKGNGLEEQVLELILSYRNKNEITELEVLNNIISDEQYEKIGGYFTTGSRYIKIMITAEIPGKRNYQINSVIKRQYLDDKWKIEVISWSEDNSFLG
ncbi:MAG: general secretion pathway protein GspK [Halanaerobiales bacterium]